MDAESNTDEWVPAAHAIRVIGMLDADGPRTICRRAHVGLIRARAKLLIVDKNPQSDADVPLEFWWAEGGAALTQDWRTGDFETWINNKIRLRAFGVTFNRMDLEAAITQPTLHDTVERTKNDRGLGTNQKRIFIGHGRSPVWRELKEFLRDRLKLEVDEFNSVPTAGISTVERLADMLEGASFAFLILTGEDEQADRKVHARLNVVHEVGLFQGRLGFKKAIVLLEEGCEEFSNIYGLGQIRFSKGKISTAYEEIRQVLEREHILIRE